MDKHFENDGERKNLSPRPPMKRRDFLKLSMLASGTFLGGGLLQSALAQGEDDVAALYRRLIPADKHLDPAWVRSLFEREKTPPVFLKSRNELRYIGMPVGGLTCGTVYLGGDGRLWVWEIFNRHFEGVVPSYGTWNGHGVPPRNGARYVSPVTPDDFPGIAQGFALRVKRPNAADEVRALDASGFEEVAFQGSYPLGEVTYTDPKFPLTAKLTAYSPFIPLTVNDSSLPVTILEYEVANTSNMAVSGDIFGWTENPVGVDTAKRNGGLPLETRRVEENNFHALHCTAASGMVVSGAPQPKRAPIVFEDFEKPTYEGWTVEGTAFGTGPRQISQIPRYQGDVGGIGHGVVNSHLPDADGRNGDEKTGKLISKPFTIERKYIHFLIGGGDKPGKECVNLVIDGKIVRSATGKNNNHMELAAFAVSDFAGQQAHIEIVDADSGPWGNIGVDQIVFDDETPTMPKDFADAPDNGDFVLALLQSEKGGAFFHNGIAVANHELSGGLPGVGAAFTLQPGEKTRVVFAFAWYFPNLKVGSLGGRFYQTRFQNALEVARYLAAHYAELSDATKLWVQTWKDSTLPHWLLDRSLTTLDTLATEDAYRFKDGRFWAWEGVGACPGTCTHVWHYAQSMPRIFPELSRNLREVTDFAISQNSRGGIAMRAESDRSVPTDGQCGIVLESFREHQMSADDAFLKRNWQHIKLAMQYLIAQDKNRDGMIEGAQPNTLDASWYGKIPVMATLYHAALRASEEMAREAGDDAFAKECRDIFERGQESIKPLFNGEYFIQIEDPAHKNAIGTGKGCYIDQVLGQWWAWQVGLGAILDPQKVRSALTAIWHHNFTTNVGAFRKEFTRGRPYAIDGDSGTIMCSWPDGGLRSDFKKFWQYEYFNECMSGFEHDVAASLVYAGSLTEGLAVIRAIHDRYHPAKRNPFNEIECSDHYARAMASYSVFLAVSGFEYHGPKAHIGFAPKLTPENFRCAFVGAEGWGTFAQTAANRQLSAQITVKHGTLRLATFVLQMPAGSSARTVSATIDGKPVAASLTANGSQMLIHFSTPQILEKDQPLNVALS